MRTATDWTSITWCASAMIGAMMLAFGGCYSEYDPTERLYTGDQTKKRLADDGAQWVNAAGLDNWYLYAGGSFGGTIRYLSFDCETEQGCWSAIEARGGPSRAHFEPWKPSEFSRVMRGPGFYHSQLASNLWDVRGITNGLVYEQVRDLHRRHDRADSMTYYAIDLDRLRVYHLRESGGFRVEWYDPTDPTPYVPLYERR